MNNLYNILESIHIKSLSEVLKDDHSSFKDLSYVNEAQMGPMCLEDYDTIISPYTGQEVDMKNLKSEMNVARALLGQQFPFFNGLADRLTWIYAYVEGLSTMATDGTRLIINPDFAVTLSVSEKMFVLAHEVLHCAMNHPQRGKFHDRTLSNIAADFEVNDICVEDKVAAESMLRRLGALYDTKYHNQSYENIFNQVTNVPDAREEQQPKQELQMPTEWEDGYRDGWEKALNDLRAKGLVESADGKYANIITEGKSDVYQEGFDRGYEAAMKAIEGNQSPSMNMPNAQNQPQPKIPKGLSPLKPTQPNNNPQAQSGSSMSQQAQQSAQQSAQAQQQSASQSQQSASNAAKQAQVAAVSASQAAQIAEEMAKQAADKSQTQGTGVSKQDAAQAAQAAKQAAQIAKQAEQAAKQAAQAARQAASAAQQGNAEDAAEAAQQAAEAAARATEAAQAAQSKTTETAQHAADVNQVAEQAQQAAAQAAGYANQISQAAQQIGQMGNPSIAKAAASAAQQASKAAAQAQQAANKAQQAANKGDMQGVRQAAAQAQQSAEAAAEGAKSASSYQAAAQAGELTQSAVENVKNIADAIKDAASKYGSSLSSNDSKVLNNAAKAAEQAIKEAEKARQDAIDAALKGDVDGVIKSVSDAIRANNKAQNAMNQASNTLNQQEGGNTIDRSNASSSNRSSNGKTNTSNQSYNSPKPKAPVAPIIPSPTGVDGARKSIGGFVDQATGSDVAKQAGYTGEDAQAKNDDQVSSDWNQAAQQAADKVGGATGSSAAARKIKEKQLTKHDWKSELKKYMGKALSSISKDERWGRRSALARDVIKKKDVPTKGALNDVSFLIDCSGSVDDDLLSRILSECYTICYRTDVTEVDYIYYTTQVEAVETTRSLRQSGVNTTYYKKLKNPKSGATGGQFSGGTSVQCAFDLLAQRQTKSTLAMVFTDGEDSSGEQTLPRPKNVENVIYVIYDNVRFSKGDSDPKVRIIHIDSNDVGKK